MPQTLTPRSPPLTAGVAGLAALLLASATAHLVRPQVFEAMVPHLLPYKRELVYVSGVAEILCGLGLLARPTRRAAGAASEVLLLAVFPANVQMSVDYARRVSRRGDSSSTAMLVASLARLPLQWPLVRAARRAAGR